MLLLVKICAVLTALCALKHPKCHTNGTRGWFFKRILGVTPTACSEGLQIPASAKVLSNFSVFSSLLKFWTNLPLGCLSGSQWRDTNLCLAGSSWAGLNTKLNRSVPWHDFFFAILIDWWTSPECFLPRFCSGIVRECSEELFSHLIPQTFRYCFEFFDFSVKSELKVKKRRPL